MDVFLARQPIFDTRGDVEAYELLYRRTADSRFADGDDTNKMSLDVVIQSFLEIGLEQITGGRSGYINFGREMLVQGTYDLLDPASIVIELLEDVVVDDHVRSACARLSEAGYRLALDDYVFGGPHEELLPYASIVKVDVLQRDLDELKQSVEQLRMYDVRLLAEKVETAEVHARCRAMGFELFQGYFYSRPEMVANRGASVELTSMVQLLNLLGDEQATDFDVEEAFRRDASLSYKLMRMLNNAANGGRGIESIRFAIRLLGRGTLQRWLSLLLASSFAGRGGTDAELVNTAVVRGRFCELLGISSGRSGYGDGLFLTGIFSLMDSLLRTPMKELMSRVDLAKPVRDALLDRSGNYAVYLQTVEAYERGDWTDVSAAATQVGLTGLEIPEIYLDAVGWARMQIDKARSATSSTAAA